MEPRLLELRNMVRVASLIVACALPFAIWFWQTPSGIDVLWFIAAGLAGTLGHLCQQRGYQLADITLLQPIGFLSLIYNTLLGYFLFFQHREAVRRARIKTADSVANPEA